MNEKWEELHGALVSAIAELCFGDEAYKNNSANDLTEAWLIQNGLGPSDLKQYFS